MIGAARSGLLGSGVAINDNAIYQYDAQALSEFDDNDMVSTWPDEISGEDMSGEATYKDNGINNNPSLEFDGSDSVGFSNAFSDTEDVPNTVIAIIEGASFSETNTITEGGDQANHLLRVGDGGDNFDIQNDGGITGGNPQTNTPYIFVGLFSGNNSRIRINGTEIASGDIGTRSLPQSAGDSWYIGQNDNETRSWDGFIGEIIAYNVDLEDEGDLSDEESRLSRKWDISLD